MSNFEYSFTDDEGTIHKMGGEVTEEAAFLVQRQLMILMDHRAYERQLSR